MRNIAALNGFLTGIQYSYKSSYRCAIFFLQYYLILYIRSKDKLGGHLPSGDVNKSVNNAEIARTGKS